MIDDKIYKTCSQWIHLASVIDPKKRQKRVGWYNNRIWYSSMIDDSMRKITRIGWYAAVDVAR